MPISGIATADYDIEGLPDRTAIDSIFSIFCSYADMHMVLELLSDNADDLSHGLGQCHGNWGRPQRLE